MDKTPLMLEVEAEFGGDIRDIIRDLRDIDGGNTWRTVAGCLGVSVFTLNRWRRLFDMPYGADEAGRRTDPTSYPYGVHPCSFEHKAIENGYAGGLDWVMELRAQRNMTTAEAAAVLGVNRHTVSAYTPEEYQFWLSGRNQYS